MMVDTCHTNLLMSGSFIFNPDLCQRHGHKVIPSTANGITSTKWSFGREKWSFGRDFAKSRGNLAQKMNFFP